MKRFHISKVWVFYNVEQPNQTVTGESVLLFDDRDGKMMEIRRQFAQITFWMPRQQMAVVERTIHCVGHQESYHFLIDKTWVGFNLFLLEMIQNSFLYEDFDKNRSKKSLETLEHIG